MKKNKSLYALVMTSVIGTASAEVEPITDINPNGGLPSPAFFEDFQSGTMPAGWALFNVDGLTPNGIVSYVTDAWVVTGNFEGVGEFSMKSTSWYEPVGQADDWVITTQITLPVHAELSWRAIAPDSGFRDGYEIYVSTSTQDIAGCTANPMVFSIDQEEVAYTPRSVSLSSQGYVANQNIYLCFRNNTNDRFMVMIDDIKVESNDIIFTDGFDTSFD